MIKFIHVWNEMCANKMKGRFMKPRNPRTLILTREISPLQSCESLLRIYKVACFDTVFTSSSYCLIFQINANSSASFLFYLELLNQFKILKNVLGSNYTYFAKRHALANQSILMSVYVSVKLFQSLRFIWSSVFLIYLIDFSIFDTWVDHLCQ